MFGSAKQPAMNEMNDFFNGLPNRFTMPHKSGMHRNIRVEITYKGKRLPHDWKEHPEIEKALPSTEDFQFAYRHALKNMNPDSVTVIHLSENPITFTYEKL